LAGGDGLACGFSKTFLGDSHIGNGDGGLIGVGGVMGVEDWKLG